MPAKIKYKIPTSSLELVRDKIGGDILTVELTEQGVIDEAFKVPEVWTERYLAFDEQELPAIVVTVDDGKYNNGDKRAVNGNYRYNIDVYTQSPTVDDNDGYVLATRQLHRVLMMVRAILMNPLYAYLDFDPGVVGRRNVEGFYIVEKEITARGKGILLNDLLSTCVARMTVVVDAIEYVEEQEGDLFNKSEVTVKLASSDRGIKFTYEP